MRAQLLGGLLLVSLLSACGDDSATDGDATGAGGEDVGPDSSAGPSTTTATTTTSTSTGTG